MKMKKNIEKGINFFNGGYEEFKKLTREDKDLFIKKLRVSPEINPSFISIINMIEYYDKTKNWKDNERNSIITDFILKFPKIHLLIIGAITNVFIFVITIMYIIFTGRVIIGVGCVFSMLAVVFLINLINKQHKELHNYYRNYLKLFNGGAIFYE